MEMKKNMNQAVNEERFTEILFGGIMASASLYALWCTVSLMISFMA